MAYLMTDVAAGSNAAMTLMENMGAAPLAQEVGKAQAEQVILNAEKTKLANLVTQQGIDASSEVKGKAAALIKTQDYLNATDGDKQRKLASLYMEAGDVEGGSKLLSASEVTDAKDLANKQKGLDVQAQQLGNAYGVIAGLDSEQKINETFSKFPPQQMEAIKQQIPNWDNFSGEEKKEALKNLMLNAKGQLAVQLKQLDYQRAQMIQDSRERIQERQDNTRLMLKAIGGSDEGKSFDSATKELAAVDSRYQKRLAAAQEAKDTAERQDDARWFSGSRDASSSAKSATKAYNDLQQKMLEEKLRIAVNHKPYTGQKEDIDELKYQLHTLGADSSQKEPPVKEEKPTAKKDVPSNKPLTPEAFDAKWATLKPGETLVGPDGQTYTKGK